MGAYINPVNQSKEDWLRENGIPTDAPNALEMTSDKMPVCLVDNGPFTAAGIAFDARELEAFTNPNDYRPKQWYWVETEKLLDPNISDLHYYLDRK